MDPLGLTGQIIKATYIAHAGRYYRQGDQGESSLVLKASQVNLGKGPSDTEAVCYLIPFNTHIAFYIGPLLH